MSVESSAPPRIIHRRGSGGSGGDDWGGRQPGAPRQLGRAGANPDWRRDARDRARERRTAGSTRGFGRTDVGRAIRRMDSAGGGSRVASARGGGAPCGARVRARKGKRRAEAILGPKEGGCPHLDRGRRPTSGTYRVNDARICLGPSMTTKKQPTRAGRSTRASLNAGPMGARTNPSPHKPPNFLPVSITHRASQAGTKIARATRGSHFCDCLALANNPEKTRRIPGYTNRRDRRV